jgi:hypothetical protein
VQDAVGGQVGLRDRLVGGLVAHLLLHAKRAHGGFARRTRRADSQLQLRLEWIAHSVILKTQRAREPARARQINKGKDLTELT